LGKFQINTLTSGIGLLVTVVLSYVLIPIYGMYGAALATSIVFAIQALIQVILFKRVAGIDWLEIYIHYKLSWASLPQRVKSYFR
jgi:O-antigen/teichoic acid export membrane protein